MRNLKLTIEYDGTKFHGWQIQKRGERTIQGEIEKALKKILRKSIRVIGAGRTDSGVHALGQVANFKVNTKLTSNQILKALNANLPKDVAILKLEDMPLNFHAQYSSKTKTYRYTILNRAVRCTHMRHFCLHDPHPLNIASMRWEAKSLIGRKDFRSFAGQNPSKQKRNQNTIRTIKRIEIKKKGEFIHIEIEGDGFLYKMVRTIVGALLEVGQGKLSKGSIKEILSAKDRKLAPKTVKPHGLCLVAVKY